MPSGCVTVSTAGKHQLVTASPPLPFATASRWIVHNRVWLPCRRTVHCFAQAPAQDFEWFMGVMKISSGHRVVYRMRHGQGFMMPGFTPDKFGDYKHFVAGLAGVPCIRLILTWRRI